MMIVPGSCFIPYLAAVSTFCADYVFSFDADIEEDCRNYPVTNSGVTTSATAKYGDAAEFDGSSYFHVNTPISYDYTDKWTLSFWFYTPLDATLYVNEDAGGERVTGIYLNILGGTPTAVQFLMSESNRPTSDTDWSNTSVSAGWNYLHLSNDVDNNLLKLWINGSLITSGDRLDLNVYAFGASTGSGGPEYYLNGYMDDIGITNDYIAGDTVPTAARTCCPLTCGSTSSLACAFNVYKYPFETDMEDACSNVTTTAVGTPQLSTTQVLVGNKSLYLDGSSYLSIDTNITADITDEWEVYYSYYHSGLGANAKVSIGVYSGQVTLFSVGFGNYPNIVLSCLSRPLGDAGIGITPSSDDTWHSVKFWNDIGDGKVYVCVDGITYTAYSSNLALNIKYIGHEDATSYKWTGYIDDVLIKTNNCGSTGGFYLLMHGNGDTVDEWGHTVSATDITYDTTTQKFGSGSLSFNGTSSVIHITDCEDVWNFNSVSWTAEFFVRIDIGAGYTGTEQYYFLGSLDGTNQGFHIYLDEDRLVLKVDGVNIFVTYSHPFNEGTATWHHIACGYNASTGKYFLCYDGNYTDTSSTDMPKSSDGIHIGFISNGFAHYLKGEMDEIRISDTAVYTGSYTVPTAEF